MLTAYLPPDTAACRKRAYTRAPTKAPPLQCTCGDVHMKQEGLHACDHLHLQMLMDRILDVRYTDLEQEFKDSKELLELSEAAGYAYGQAFALTYISDYYLAHNDSRSAGSYLERALALCQKNKYNELLMNAHIFAGIYYDLLLDRQMSLNHTLDALELSTQLKDGFRRSVIINNIANIFEYFGDMQAAKRYYEEALSCAGEELESSKGAAHYAILISNVVHIACILGDLEEAKMYTENFAVWNFPGANYIGPYYSCLCHLAAANKDLDMLRENTDKFLDLLADNESWAYQFFEVTLYIANHLLDLSDEKYARKTLMAIGRLCGEGEEGSQLRAQCIWVRYYEMFGTEEQQGWAYKRYYKLKQVVDIATNKAMSEGLHAKIKLHEATKRHEEMCRKNKELESEAQVDQMTQVYNRRSFTKLVSQTVADENVKTLGFAMIDVDYFKEYNDSYGHAKGDDVLRAVAECMTLAAGNSGFIYNFRYGGDEFMCMYANCTESEMESHVKNIAEMVRGRHIPHKFSRSSDALSLSIGFSVCQRSEDGSLDAVALLAKADKALYWSKGRGRDSYCQYDPTMESMLNK